jgi:hypothetical protein
MKVVSHLHARRVTGGMVADAPDGPIGARAQRVAGRQRPMRSLISVSSGQNGLSGDVLDMKSG